MRKTTRNRIPLTSFDEYVAGVNYNNRSTTISSLSLRDPIFLHPQTGNLHDPNAIAVETKNGDHIGYLRSDLAASLRKHFDDQKVEGVITELSCEAHGSSYRVRIRFSLPSSCFDSPTVNLPPALEYFFDGSGLNTYLLLNCSDDLFTQVREQLKSAHIRFTKQGLCYRPASNGRQYQWYVRLEKHTNAGRTHIETFFEKHFDTIPNPIDRERVQLESEIAELKSSLTRARQEAEQYEALAIQIDSENIQHRQRLNETIEQLQVRLTGREFEVRRLEEAQHRNERQTVGTPRTNSADTQYDIPEHVSETFRKYAGKHLTPTEALEVINNLFPNRIEILDPAWKSAKSSNGFNHKAKLLELLWTLATEYWGALASGRTDADAGSVFGVHYAPTESETVKKERRKLLKRTFTYNGTPIEMLKHLKIGTKESDAETLRIHFHWLASSKKLLIGHCGPHL